ncbi:FK506-binding protein 1A-like [Lingula anatina]|uniref:peptidylprolyl isomerase n=1 Tax=Lingula anatina TaxID=7574 RepID=A0A1S3JV96_LINAN|nr:FK506-binding protein 1A-like [Lingula anatina]|eukprot:XP_013414315.1 FK506-binding protein 1A-like [Lingula anatina]
MGSSCRFAMCVFVYIFYLLVLGVCGEIEVFEVDGVKVERLKIPETCDFSVQDGDQLKIHYRGTLEDGTEFDSSYSRNSPFAFTIGKGQVIKGWDIGIKGMCIGEKRKLTIPPDKGYGDQGFPPKIPGGATLIFETELIDID